jgi:hypothetical protein
VRAHAEGSPGRHWRQGCPKQAPAPAGQSGVHAAADWGDPAVPARQPPDGAVAVVAGAGRRWAAPAAAVAEVGSADAPVVGGRRTVSAAAAGEVCGSEPVAPAVMLRSPDAPPDCQATLRRVGERFAPQPCQTSPRCPRLRQGRLIAAQTCSGWRLVQRDRVRLHRPSRRRQQQHAAVCESARQQGNPRRKWEAVERPEGARRLAEPSRPCFLRQAVHARAARKPVRRASMGEHSPSWPPLRCWASGGLAYWPVAEPGSPPRRSCPVP